MRRGGHRIPPYNRPMAIEIPRELLPVDGRFGCGPSKVRPAQVEALASVGESLLGTSHRQLPVKNLVASARERLSTLFRLPDGYEIILGKADPPRSGTPRPSG